MHHSVFMDAVYLVFDEESFIGFLLPLIFVDFVLLFSHFFGDFVVLLIQECPEAHQFRCNLRDTHHNLMLLPAIFAPIYIEYGGTVVPVLAIPIFIPGPRPRPGSVLPVVAVPAILVVTHW